MSLNRSPQLITVAKNTARELRRRQTEGEGIFWEAVRNRRFMGKKFLRQHPILHDQFGKETFYVADFYCAEARLVVEIDGGIHEAQPNYDELRTIIITKLKYSVIRFKNAEVADIPFIHKTLSPYLSAISSAPPLLKREGAGG